MVRTLLATLAALLIGLMFVGVAHSQTVYLPVMERGLLTGPNVAEQFADRLDAAIAADPSGNAPIVGGVGGYSPRMAYQALRDFHPETGLTNPNPGRADLEAMADYWRTLRVTRTTEPMRLRNTRMVRRGNVFTHDLNWTFTLPAGTPVLVDRNTGAVIAKIDCGNILGPVAPPPPPREPCIWLIIPAQGPVTNSSQLLSSSYVDTRECTVKMSGPGTGPQGRHFEPSDFGPLDGGAAHPCDWTEVVQFYGQPQTPIHGCREIGRGWYAIQLDPSFLDNPNNIFVVCQRTADGRVSLSVDVRPQHFFRNADGVYIATVWPSEALTPAGYRWTMLWIEWDLSRAPELIAESRQWLSAAGL